MCLRADSRFHPANFISSTSREVYHRWGSRLLTLGLGRLECVARVSNLLPHDNELPLMGSSQRGAAAHQNATANKFRLVVCAPPVAANKSIENIFMIRRYIHFKGQTCLKQAAEDICKYYRYLRIETFDAGRCPLDTVDRSTSGPLRVDGGSEFALFFV